MPRTLDVGRLGPWAGVTALRSGGWRCLVGWGFGCAVLRSLWRLLWLMRVCQG